MISAILQCVDGHWGQALITLGLLLDALGALFLASVLFVGKDEAAKRTEASVGVTDPAYQALLSASRRGKLGAGLLVSGFALQICGIWL